MTRQFPFLIAIILLPLVLSCQEGPPPAQTLQLATTTSTDNSGLLAYLLPMFEKQYGLKVHVIAVGTGQALALGRNGDVDVVLVHAPDAEEQFMKDGCGVNRRPVMYNDFIIVGPAADPAGVAKAASAGEALAQIAKAAAPFASRGDKSGTHMKEQSLWKAAGMQPSGAWYMETGQGMEMTLLLASEKQGYTLTDRGTYLAAKAKLRLGVLFEGGPALRNPYSIIAVNPACRPQINRAGAMSLITWMTSAEGQRAIGDFKVGGEVLFHPSATPAEGR